MSSEAAAYFPDALTGTSEVCGSTMRAPEVNSELPQETPLKSAREECFLQVLSPLSETSDESLLEQVRDGAKEALAILFRRHARAVRNISYRILRDESEADDLVQEVFLHIFRKAGVYDVVPGAARSWIFHVAYHCAFDRRRYLNSRHFYSSQELEDTALRLADPRNELPFHEQSIEGVLGKQLTEKFNARLTREQRETIQLFFFEGYALKEIAQRTGRPLVNVRSHYYRGLEKLRKYVLPKNCGQSE
jgi:RNA polymerase sigma-70 factor, ECF subfamily